MKTKLNSAAYFELLKITSKIDRIDPCSPAYKKMIAFLDALPDDQITALAEDNIKWISALAKNRAVRRGLIKSKLAA